MDVAEEIEKTFKIPRNVLALLAITFGILILFFPIMLYVIVGFLLILWGLMEAVRAGSTPKSTTSTS